jgi:uncharacterized protein YnzC (UPF0291/DUF896 family)
MMDVKEFNKMAEELDDKINMVDEFIARAHEEGISTFEAISMQNHVRRQFNTKHRNNFRKQLASLYRERKITIDQKERIEHLLDKASKLADEHFIRLSKIVPESQVLEAPMGLPGFLTEKQGDSRAKKVLGWLGFEAS